VKESEFNKLVDELIFLCFEISCGDYYSDRVLEFDDVVDLLGSKLENNWVPCSDSMPEDILSYNEKTSQPVINVLVTTENGKVTKLQRIGDKGYDEKHELTWRWGRIHGGIKAWQPLPEGYKEGK